MRGQRGKRQKKAERILYSSQSKEAVMCDFALGPVDQMANQMDQKWGIDRLPELVSVELAQKYGRQMSMMNEAVADNDVERTRKKAEQVIKGMVAMDAEAERLGAQRASDEVWEVDVDGELFGVMRDGRAWKEIKAQRPELELLTLREVALAYKWFRENRLGELEKAVKQSFPGAEMTDLKGKAFDDPIPF